MKSIFEVEQTGHVERKQGAIYFGDSVCQMPQKKKNSAINHISQAEKLHNVRQRMHEENIMTIDGTTN